jgi:hypothetical protein
MTKNKTSLRYKICVLAPFAKKLNSLLFIKKLRKRIVKTKIYTTSTLTYKISPFSPSGYEKRCKSLMHLNFMRSQGQQYPFMLESSTPLRREQRPPLVRVPPLRRHQSSRLWLHMKFRCIRLLHRFS